MTESGKTDEGITAGPDAPATNLGASSSSVVAAPLSDERLAEIRAEFGPESVYSSGVAGDGVCVMGNELLAEIDRLNTVLDANRVVRNAAESSCRVYKAVTERLKAERTGLRAELDRCAGLNRDLVNENADATTRAETAERELAEMRATLRPEYGYRYRTSGPDEDPEATGFDDEATARRIAAHGDTIMRRFRTDWEVVDDDG